MVMPQALFLREILTRFTKLALVLLILMLQTCYCIWVCTTIWLILAITKNEVSGLTFWKKSVWIRNFSSFFVFYHLVPHLAPYSKSSNEYIWFLVFLKTSSHYYLSFKTNINLLRYILRSQWAFEKDGIDSRETSRKWSKYANLCTASLNVS